MRGTDRRNQFGAGGFLQHVAGDAEAQFKRLQSLYGFTIIDGHRSMDAIFAELQQRIEAVLADFRARYGVSPGVPIYGPYSGKLNNANDDVSLTIYDPGGNIIQTVDLAQLRQGTPPPTAQPGGKRQP